MRRKGIAGIIAVVSLVLATQGILVSGVKSTGVGTTLQVLPGLVTYTPANVTDTFIINVTVSNVLDFFGYEFRLRWNTTLLDCSAADVTPPADWGTNYVTAVNEINKTLGQYWLAVAALPPALPLTGNASLARLTFKVVYNPMYSENISDSQAFHLFDTMLTDEDADEIKDVVTIDGAFQYNSLWPVVKVLPSNYTATTGGLTFEAQVWVFNVTNLASFTFYLTYNPALLDASVPRLGTIFRHPSGSMVSKAPGTVAVSQYSLTSSNGSGLLGTIAFTTRRLASNDSCILNLTTSELRTIGDATIPHDTINGQYNYTMLRGDVDGDCKVAMKDISIVCKAYGSKPGDPQWNPLADLTGDNKINLLDIAIVCTNFGKGM